MAVRRVEADKNTHPASVMGFVYNEDVSFAAVCGECKGYAIVTDEEASNGRALCFGAVILITDGR
jgi:formylmethanofuran dehydrogenase subunit E